MATVCAGSEVQVSIGTEENANKAILSATECQETRERSKLAGGSRLASNPRVESRAQRLRNERAAIEQHRQSLTVAAVQTPLSLLPSVVRTRVEQKPTVVSYSGSSSPFFSSSPPRGTPLARIPVPRVFADEQLVRTSFVGGRWTSFSSSNGAVLFVDFYPRHPCGLLDVPQRDLLYKVSTADPRPGTTRCVLELRSTRMLDASTRRWEFIKRTIAGIAHVGSDVDR
ncbi:unnamed protein product [Xylocopa violacea]|uniref:Uncharacterized protein n=1 Tax=Xylocopa violacea TaxID=135666 RepID=A0ABP1NYE4_XYLVO